MDEREGTVTWREALHWCIDHLTQSVRDRHGDPHWVEHDGRTGHLELCSESAKAQFSADLEPYRKAGE